MLRTDPKAYLGVLVFLLGTLGTTNGVERHVPSEYSTIQAAINNCNNGDVVIVAPGTYAGATISALMHNVAITVRSIDPNDAEITAATVIDCKGVGSFWFIKTGTVNCRVEGFTVTNNTYIAAIYCYRSSPTIRNCILTNNSGQAAMRCYNRSSPTIANCDINGNSCRGMRIGASSHPTVWNCIITGNSREGLYCYDSSPTLSNCTITNNAAGMLCEDEHGHSNPTITNSILWENSYYEIFLRNGASVSISYSDIGGGWDGEGNIDVDPCFANPDGNDYHLRSDSPCIDAGDNDSVPADTTDLDGDGNTTEPIPWDLDGNPRVVDGDSDGNAVIDMGAYEYFVPPVEVAMKFTPQALNPGSRGRWVKAHFVLPEEYMVEDVDANAPAVVQPGGIESDYINVFINESNLVEVEAAFERGAFCEAGISDEAIEVTVTGSFTSGQQFYGTDTIKITHNYLEYLEVLAVHWLEAGCGKPDWCEGADLDEDSVVNFVDFALFDGCCIEVTGE
ncbi:MAG: right-handed parallel beta-helix repeat-containing protein [Planctomycetota bacterium]|jgi:parallel beta-helix repeat protein